MADNTTKTIMPSPHAEAAKVFLDKIRALRAEIPRFEPEVPEEARKILQKSLVPDEAMEAASVSIQTFPDLEHASKTDAATLRDAFAYALAYGPVVQEARAFARSVAYTIKVQRAIAGASALDIYYLAQRFSQRKDGAEYLPFVEDMKRKLLKRKRTRKATEPAPAPDAPSTQAPPAAPVTTKPTKQ